LSPPRQDSSSGVSDQRTSPEPPAYNGTYVRRLLPVMGTLGFPFRRAVTVRHRGQAGTHRDRGRDSDASRVAGRHRATAQRPRTASSVPMRRLSRPGRSAARCRPSQGTDRSGDRRRQAGRQLRDQLDIPARRTSNRDLLIRLPAESPGRGRLTKRSRRKYRHSCTPESGATART